MDKANTIRKQLEQMGFEDYFCTKIIDLYKANSKLRKIIFSEIQNAYMKFENPKIDSFQWSNIVNEIKLLLEKINFLNEKSNDSEIEFVCSNCFETIENCKCDSHNFLSITDIDKDIYPAIKKLNKLGYETKFCCQGHINNGTIQAYIYFSNDSKNEILPTLPNNWKYESYKYAGIVKYRYNIIRTNIPFSRYKLSKLTDKEKQEYIQNNIISLNKWVEDLPLRSETIE